ncbi:SubName: Full=Uncharacterized protein {ECO:0000313/EMBL:CCA75628.1} [Serendipita indica DSM 11827]|nr:SubName: Full=Uncharacterized protein {ECO:0000313/EMBL:CCA75628.1} [Serendipita indica DSM 11827]
MAASASAASVANTFVPEHLFIEVVTLVTITANAVGFRRNLRTLNRSANGGIIHALCVDGMIFYLGIICIHVAEVTTFCVAPL